MKTESEIRKWVKDLSDELLALYLGAFSSDLYLEKDKILARCLEEEDNRRSEERSIL